MKHLKEAKLKLLANKTFGSSLGHRKGVLGEGEKQTDGVGGGGGGKIFFLGGSAHGNKEMMGPNFYP